jgi:LysM repeat protein
MEWKNTGADDDMHEEQHYTTLKSGASGILGEKSKLPLIIILAGVLFLVALFFILNPRPPRTAQPEADVIDARLALLERQINEIDRIKEKLVEMDARMAIDTVSVMDIDKLVDAIQANAAALSRLDGKIGQMEKQLKKTAEKAQAPPVVSAPQKTAPSAPAQAPAPVAAKPGDGLMYHTVQKGDTLYRLSVKYGISVPKLQELNNLGTETEIFPGQQVVVGPAKH